MEAYGAIDPHASQETRLTNEEAQAVIGLWSLQRRLNDDALSKPTVNDIAESLNIPADEVRKYLELARATQKSGVRTPRSLKADLTLAFAALAVLAFIVFCIVTAFVGTRMRAEAPAYVASYGTTTAAPAPFAAEAPRSALVGYSNGPKKVVIGVGTDLVTPRYDYRITPTADQVRGYIVSAVGGPLADNSFLKNGSVSPGQIQEALHSSPSSNSNLLQWKKVQVAYGGKVVEAQFPFAKLADRDLREAVAREHARLVQSLVDNVIAITGQ